MQCSVLRPYTFDWQSFGKLGAGRHKLGMALSRTYNHPQTLSLPAALVNVR